jgi:hypothetical protein
MAKMLAQIGDDDFCIGFSQHFFRRMQAHDGASFYRKLRPEERKKAILLQSHCVTKIGGDGWPRQFKTRRKRGSSLFSRREAQQAQRREASTST